MFMILSSRMLVNLATLFLFFGKFSVELEMTNPPCWYRAWRTIPTNNSSMLWFSTTDVSTYLHLNLSASFLASEIKNTNVRLAKKTQLGRHPIVSFEVQQGQLYSTPTFFGNNPRSGEVHFVGHEKHGFIKVKVLADDLKLLWGVLVGQGVDDRKDNQHCVNCRLWPLKL